MEQREWGKSPGTKRDWAATQEEIPGRTDRGPSGQWQHLMWPLSPPLLPQTTKGTHTLGWCALGTREVGKIPAGGSMSRGIGKAGSKEGGHRWNRSQTTPIILEQKWLQHEWGWAVLFLGQSVNGTSGCFRKLKEWCPPPPKWVQCQGTACGALL